MGKVPLTFFKKRPLTEFQREKESTKVVVERTERVIEKHIELQPVSPDEIIKRINEADGQINWTKVFGSDAIDRAIVDLNNAISRVQRVMVQGFSGVKTETVNTGSTVTPATTVMDETTYGVAKAVGTGTAYARSDHTHGTVATPTKTTVGLANVDNTSDASKPVSTATQTALDLKAPIASPTFTGTVAGVTKSMVGLGSVDNTSDAGKPISTATQAALDLKANLSGVVALSSTVSLTNQGADIADTAFSVSTAGLYRIEFYIMDTTADLTAGSVTLNIKYSDDAAARTISAQPIVLTATTGFGQGEIVARLASGTITYGVTHTGIFGSAKYALYLTQEKLI